jgi:phospholipase C
MKALGYCALASLAFVACAQALPPQTAGTSQAPVPPGSLRLAPAVSKIHHIVIIFQENRTPDNLFNGFPGADTVRSGKNSQRLRNRTRER